MKETSFIEQNKKKWNRFEQLYASKSNDPDELSDLYMDITDDLSYAQTFYRRRTVRVYLNQLAQKVYTGVHKQKGESLKKFITVWKTSLPLEIYRSRKNLLFALIAFLVYVSIGVFSTHMDPDFARIVMGDAYVEGTLENIENNNPLGIYGQELFTGQEHDDLVSFVSITTNNIKVAFLTFFLGFFFTAGTHMLMFYNGVMLGSFQYFFHTKGLLLTSFLGIWIHGAFEISAIVLAAGAGITAGNGLLFPGSYTRLQSLQLSTKRGLKIMMSLVPFLIAAGFLESYVTQNYKELPDWSKWMLITLCFAIVLFFYVFYPIYVARKNPHLIDEQEFAEFRPVRQFDFFRIRTIGQVIADSFQMYRAQFSKFAVVLVLIVLPLMIGLTVWQNMNHYEFQKTQHWYDWAAQLSVMMGYRYTNLQDIIVLASWTILYAIMMTAVFWCVQNLQAKFSWSSFFQYAGKRFIGIWLANLFLCVFVLASPWQLLLPGMFLIPVFYLVAASAALGEGSLGSRISRGFKFSGGHYWKTFVVVLILCLMTVLIVQPIAFFFSIHFDYGSDPEIRDFLDMLVDFVERIAMLSTDDYMVYGNITRQVVYIIVVLFLVPLAFFTMALGYFSERERAEATGLRKQLDFFGKRSRTQETEADFE